MTNMVKYGVIYIVNTQYSTRYNGYVNSNINLGTDSVGNGGSPMGAWLNSSTWMGANQDFILVIQLHIFLAGILCCNL